MLSLSPRLDLFDFEIPKTFIPEEVLNKYAKLIRKHNPSVITDPVKYLNESIIGLSIPSISGLLVSQQQISSNSGLITDSHFITEPHHENHTLSADNILTKIDNNITITFRLNQGLLNYFMLYETTFYRYCRPQLYSTDETFILYLKDENEKYIAKVMFYQPEIDAIDGLEFSFNKMERGMETFTITVGFNNIDFDFLYENGE